MKSETPGDKKSQTPAEKKPIFGPAQPVKCFRCGREGHKKANCPAAKKSETPAGKKSCFVCKSPWHKTEQCPTKPKSDPRGDAKAGQSRGKKPDPQGGNKKGNVPEPESDNGESEPEGLYPDKTERNDRKRVRSASDAQDDTARERKRVKIIVKTKSKWCLRHHVWGHEETECNGEDRISVQTVSEYKPGANGKPAKKALRTHWEESPYALLVAQSSDAVPDPPANITNLSELMDNLFAFANWYNGVYEIVWRRDDIVAWGFHLLKGRVEEDFYVIFREMVSLLLVHWDRLLEEISRVFCKELFPMVLEEIKAHHSQDRSLQNKFPDVRGMSGWIGVLAHVQTSSPAVSVAGLQKGLRELSEVADQYDFEVGKLRFAVLDLVGQFPAMRLDRTIMGVITLILKSAVKQVPSKEARYPLQVFIWPDVTALTDEMIAFFEKVTKEEGEDAGGS